MDIVAGFVLSFEGFEVVLGSMNLCCHIGTDSLLSQSGEESVASDTGLLVRPDWLC